LNDGGGGISLSSSPEEYNNNNVASITGEEKEVSKNDGIDASGGYIYALASHYHRSGGSVHQNQQLVDEAARQRTTWRLQKQQHRRHSHHQRCQQPQLSQQASRDANDIAESEQQPSTMGMTISLTTLRSKYNSSKSVNGPN
jgi:hypothetical protein